MDLIKKLTGKNPTEYEIVAKSLVDNSQVDLFKNLVKQDDFLFDFIKDNVAKRIRMACNKDNYLNLINFLEYYSPSYDTMIANVLISFGDENTFSTMKDLFYNGSNSQKAYAVKYFSLCPKEKVSNFIQDFRITAKSDFEPLQINSIELLSLLQDDIIKNEFLEKLNSDDEFEQYEGIKFLVNYRAKDCLKKIISIMKKSSLSENIASEIPYLIDLNELLVSNLDDCILILCNIINAIPEIIPPSAVCDYGLMEIFEKLELSSTSAVLIQLAKDKFAELLSNDEYLYDCDKNAKEEINVLNEYLKTYNTQKLKSFMYEELYEESDFVFFAIDYIDEKEELEELLNSKNQTLILKILTVMKEKGILDNHHKELALNNITYSDIKKVIEVL